MTASEWKLGDRWWADYQMGLHCQVFTLWRSSLSVCSSLVVIPSSPNPTHTNTNSTHNTPALETIITKVKTETSGKKQKKKKTTKNSKVHWSQLWVFCGENVIHMKISDVLDRWKQTKKNTILYRFSLYFLKLYIFSSSFYFSCVFIIKAAAMPLG